MLDDFAQGGPLRRLARVRFMWHMGQPAGRRKSIQQIRRVISAVVRGNEDVKPKHTVPANPLHDEGPLVAHTCCD